MPFADPQRQKEYSAKYGAAWYRRNHDLIKQRAKKWKRNHPESARRHAQSYRRRHNVTKTMIINAPVPIGDNLSTQTTIIAPQPIKRLPGESSQHLNARRSLNYYYTHKAEIQAKNEARKKENNNMMQIPISVPMPSDYISPRMAKLIAEMGEPTARWYESVRQSICEGKCLLKTEEDKEKWWGLLKGRIVNKIGTHCFEKPSRGPCINGLFVN
jgi:hypothetical protein